MPQCGIQTRLLAGAVVEHVTGQKYFDYVKSALLQPAGITEVEVISTLASGRTNNEAIAEDQGLGLSPINLASQLLVPAVYGGDGEINEVGDPNDGLGASAFALAQFIRIHAVWGNGPRPTNGTFGWLARSGSAGGLDAGGIAWGWDRLGLHGQHAGLATFDVSDVG
jgi:CubicO group peptidase (beta-lactamase class C family)